jgi:hypothetical protein
MKIKMRLILSLILLGSFRAVHAEEEILKPHNYRQEVRDSLKELQSYLDNMFLYQELTPDQYKTECKRVRQLGFQLGVDFRNAGSMSEHERNSEFTSMDQIQREATQWSAANRKIVPYVESATTLRTLAR